MYLGADSYNTLVPKYNSNNHKDIEKTYSLDELRALRIKEIEYYKKLTKIKMEKEKAMEQCGKLIKKYFPFSKVLFDDHTNCKIITKRFKIEDLESMKSDLNLKKVTVQSQKENIVININW